eukprot:s1596_g6.t1
MLNVPYTVHHGAVYSWRVLANLASSDLWWTQEDAFGLCFRCITGALWSWRTWSAMRRHSIGFVAWCGVALCAPSVNLEDPLSLGSCTCDLTQAQCDVNCCCDPDCAGLASGFTCLPEGPQSATSQYCYSKSWLHSVNPRVDLWVISDDLKGLLCVSVDNSAVQGEVFQNEALLSSSQIDAIIQEQSPPTSTVAGDVGDVAVRGYRAGDVLKVNSALGQTVELIQGASTLETASLEVVRPLSIAAAGPSGTCATGNGQVVRFLNEVPPTSCWKQVDLATQCTTTLNPRQILDTWMLHSQYLPEDMRCGERCLIPTTCLVQRKAADGSVVSLGCDGNTSVTASSFATGSDGCTCTGAVENLHFQFHFGLVSDVVSITKVNVSYSIQDIYSAGCQPLRVQQGGSIHFLQDQSGSQLVEARSGNPGYITGLPLLVADCTLVDGSCNYGGRRDATVPGILPGGKCALLNASTAETQEVKINFGENAIFGCTLDLTRAELKSLCGGTAALANGFVGYLKMLPFGSTGSSWTQIAAFGSVPNDAQDSADFVQVEESARRALHAIAITIFDALSLDPSLLDMLSLDDNI